MIRFAKEQRGVQGGNLYLHFFEEGHTGLEGKIVKLID